MTNRIATISLVTLLATLPAFAQNTCDQACLEGLAEKYLDALVATDMSLLPTTANFKMTEDGVRLMPGDGYIRSLNGKGKYRLFVTDEETGNVAVMATMVEEPNAPVLLAARLKVTGQQVAEIEGMLVRDTAGANALEALGKPNAAFTSMLSPDQIPSRAELIATANAYFNGMERNDGNGTYPFADNCVRVENGIQVTNNPKHYGQTIYGGGAGFGAATAKGKAKGKGKAEPPPPPTGFNPSTLGCREQLESGYYHFVTQVRDRRFVAVDPERGLVFSFVFFDHAAGPNRDFALADGTTVSAGPTRPFTWERAEVFKISAGDIQRIETLRQQVPYRMGSGWSTHAAAMSSDPVDYK